MDNGLFYLRLENVTGEKTGTVYNGEFQVKKYLTNREGIDVSRLTETLCAGIVRNESQIIFLTTLANLAFHVVKAPDWWGDRGFDLLDKEPVWQLGDKLLELQKPPKKEEVAPQAP
jgi:hypothetical protein